MRRKINRAVFRDNFAKLYYAWAIPDGCESLDDAWSNQSCDEQLASELGVSAFTIYSWRTGYTMPRKGNLEKIAKFFDVTVDELLKVA